jgi:hypothetical protein
MKFETKQYIQGKPFAQAVHTKDVATVRAMMDKQFQTDGQVFAIEETSFENGKIEFTLKDKQHKVILQIKQV